MDPVTLRQYIDTARYQLEQAAQQRAALEQKALTYQQYVEDYQTQAQSYAATEDSARRDLEYYGNQLNQIMLAEQQAAQY